MPPEPVTWTAGAILAVLTALLGFAKWLLPFLKKWEEDRLRVKTERGIRSTQELYSNLRALESEGVPRTIVFAGHNGGGVPSAGTPFYTSAIHWNTGIEDPWMPEKYQELPVDASYAQMLVTIMDEGSVRFTTEDMAPCMLRDFYEAEGVSDSIVLNLGINNNRLYYMSAAKFEGRFTDNEVTNIKLRANSIRQILQS